MNRKSSFRKWPDFLVGVYGLVAIMVGCQTNTPHYISQRTPTPVVEAIRNPSEPKPEKPLDLFVRQKDVKIRRKAPHLCLFGEKWFWVGLPHAFGVSLLRRGGGVIEFCKVYVENSGHTRWVPPQSLGGHAAKTRANPARGSAWRFAPRKLPGPLGLRRTSGANLLFRQSLPSSCPGHGFARVSRSTAQPLLPHERCPRRAASACGAAPRSACFCHFFPVSPTPCTRHLHPAPFGPPSCWRSSTHAAT